MMGKVWAFLRSADNRTVLGWLAGGVLAAAVALVGLWLQPRPATTLAPTPASSVSVPGVSAPGGVAIGGDVTGGTFHIGSPPPSRAGP